MRYRCRDRLWPLARQGYGYGRADAQLMRDFREHGLPPVTARAAARSWFRLLRRLPELTSRELAGSWWYGAAGLACRAAGRQHPLPGPLPVRTVPGLDTKGWPAQPCVRSAAC
jgi:hypothetical protein